MSHEEENRASVRTWVGGMRSARGPPWPKLRLPYSRREMYCDQWNVAVVEVLLLTCASSSMRRALRAQFVLTGGSRLALPLP